jgi:hypothetical protein
MARSPEKVAQSLEILRKLQTAGGAGSKVAGRHRIGMTSRRPLSCSKGRWKQPSAARSRSCALATR